MGYFQIIVDESYKLTSVYTRLLNKTNSSKAKKALLMGNKELMEFTRKIYQNITSHPDTPAKGSGKPEIEELSTRELEVLHLLSQGLSNRDISQKLFLSVGTVKWHTSNIYGKMGVRSRSEAVALARNLKLLK